MPQAEFFPGSGGIAIGCCAGSWSMSFDVLAPHYRWMEFLLAGGKLQRCRTTFLSQVDHCQNVLIVGEGNGCFLLECRRALGPARITCLDASARMLALAHERLLAHGLDALNVQWVQADALTWTPPAQAFDLIVTHFFLDCFRPEQLERVIGALAGAASADATWLLADFQVPTAGWRRRRAQVVHWMMYTFFRAVTRLPARKLTVPDTLLLANNFILCERQVSNWGLLRTDKWRRGATTESPDGRILIRG